MNFIHIFMILRFITLLLNSRLKQKARVCGGCPTTRPSCLDGQGAELHTLSTLNSGLFEHPVVNDPVVLKEVESFGGRLIVLAPECSLLP